MTRATCSIDGCGRKHYARGLCKKHHNRAWLASRPGLKQAYRATQFAKRRLSLLNVREPCPKCGAEFSPFVRQKIIRRRPQCQTCKVAARRKASREWLPRREYTRAQHRRMRRDLGGPYVRILLRRGSPSLPIPSALVEAKRAELQIRRHIRSAKP